MVRQVTKQEIIEEVCWHIDHLDEQIENAEKASLKTFYKGEKEAYQNILELLEKFDGYESEENDNFFSPIYTF